MGPSPIEFRKPVPEMLSSSSTITRAAEISCCWKLSSEWKPILPELYDGGLECLKKRYEKERVEDHLGIYWKERLFTCDIYGDPGRAYVQNTIGCCDTVSVVTDAHEDDTVISAGKDVFGKLQFFAVCVIIKYKKQELWVMEKLREESNLIITVRSSRVYIFFLN